MATKWTKDKGPARAKPNLCRNCQRGLHLAGPKTFGCDRRACECFCTKTESALPARQPVVARLPIEMPDVFSMLRRHNVICRATRDHRLVWKPKPSELPPGVGFAIKAYELELVRILFPDDEPKLVSVDQHQCWTTGKVGRCVGCGQGAALYDPLGQCRHRWCGWLGQRV